MENLPSISQHVKEFNSSLTQSKMNKLKGIEQLEKMCSDFCRKKWRSMIGQQEAHEMIISLKEAFAASRKTPGLPIYSHLTVNGKKFNGRRSTVSRQKSEFGNLEHEVTPCS